MGAAHLIDRDYVVAKKAEIDREMDEMQAFFKSALFKGLHHGEQIRMLDQADVMLRYSNILAKRIAVF